LALLLSLLLLLLLLLSSSSMGHVIFRLREPFCDRAPRPTSSHRRIAFEVPRWLSVRFCRRCWVHRGCRYRLDLWPPTWPRHRLATECPPRSSLITVARAPHPFPPSDPTTAAASRSPSSSSGTWRPPFLATRVPLSPVQSKSWNTRYLNTY